MAMHAWDRFTYVSDSTSCKTVRLLTRIQCVEFRVSEHARTCCAVPRIVVLEVLSGAFLVARFLPARDPLEEY